MVRPKKSVSSGTGSFAYPGITATLLRGRGGLGAASPARYAATRRPMFLPAAAASTTVDGPVSQSPAKKTPACSNLRMPARAPMATIT